MTPRCSPIKITWLRALAGFAVKRGWLHEAFVLLVSFDCLLRSAEGADLKIANFSLNKKQDSCLLVLSSSNGHTRTAGKLDNPRSHAGHMGRGFEAPGKTWRAINQRRRLHAEAAVQNIAERRWPDQHGPPALFHKTRRGHVYVLRLCQLR